MLLRKSFRNQKMFNDVQTLFVETLTHELLNVKVLLILNQPFLGTNFWKSLTFL